MLHANALLLKSLCRASMAANTNAHKNSSCDSFASEAAKAVYTELTKSPRIRYLVSSVHI